MTKVDPDSRPGGRTAAHGIDQYIIDGEVLSGLGMFLFPPFETGERGVLIGGVGDGEERHSGA